MSINNLPLPKKLGDEMEYSSSKKIYVIRIGHTGGGSYTDEGRFKARPGYAIYWKKRGKPVFYIADSPRKAREVIAQFIETGRYPKPGEMDWITARLATLELASRGISGSAYETW